MTAKLKFIDLEVSDLGGIHKMEFRLETVYLGAKRFLYEKKSKITIENKTIKIPIPVKNDEMTVVKIPTHLGTDY